MKITKPISDRLKTLSVDQACVIYGKDVFDGVVMCRSRKRNNYFNISFLDKIKITMLVLLNKTICFCHGHDGFKELSQTDFENMVPNIPYMITFNETLYAYIKKRKFVSPQLIEVLND